MSPYLGQTENGVKTTITTNKVLPERVIYDVALTTSLPPKFAATSGLNAIAHAVEALYAENTNPIICLMAEEGIYALHKALPTLLENPDDRKARYNALYGAWLCAVVQGLTRMSLHHKICHAIGGAFDLSHADTHANVLPHVVAYNASDAKHAMRTLARALETEDPAMGLFELNKRLGIHASLKTLGMPDTGAQVIIDQVTSQTFRNPRKIDENSLSVLLDNALYGRPPEQIGK
jgi:alcohol dehydrogenase class IV